VTVVTAGGRPMKRSYSGWSMLISIDGTVSDFGQFIDCKFTAHRLQTIYDTKQDTTEQPT
jgi:hypothetical protein